MGVWSGFEKAAAETWVVSAAVVIESAQDIDRKNLQSYIVWDGSFAAGLRQGQTKIMNLGVDR